MNCSSTNDVYNNSSWNTSNEINLDEYNEFSISVDSCFDLTLLTLTFSHRVSNVNSVPTWHIRSSVDDFSTDLGFGQSGTLITSSTINLPSNFIHLKTTSFRIYLTSAYASSTTWRNDNVSLSGIVATVVPQFFFADNDGDTFGDSDSSVLTCDLPAGYVENALDCDDGNNQNDDGKH